MRLIERIGIMMIMLSITFTSAAETEFIQIDLEESNSLWELAMNSGNPGTFAELYAEDAVIMTPSLEIFSSRLDIEKFWLKTIAPIANNFQVQTISIRIDGELAYQTAVWLASVTSNGVTNDIDGEMTTMLQRQHDGSWKIRLQSWN